MQQTTGSPLDGRRLGRGRTAPPPTISAGITKKWTCALALLGLALAGERPAIVVDCQQTAAHLYNGTLAPRAEHQLWSFYEPGYARAAETCRRARESNGTVDELCHEWMMKYVDEETGGEGNEVLLVESSLDERAANLLYAVLAGKPINLDFFVFDSGDKRRDELNMNSVAGPQVDDELCGQHLRRMLQLLGQLEARVVAKRQNASFQLNLSERDIRLARVLDSFGHYDAGLLMGRTHFFGNFDQCITSRLLLAPPPAPPPLPHDATDQRDSPARRQQAERDTLVGARYCWARLSMDAHLEGRLRARQSFEFEPRQKRLMVATCLPESCHSRSFHLGARASENKQLAQRLLERQFRLPSMLFLDTQLELDSIYCLVDETSEHQASLPLAGILTLCFIGAWLLLAIVATCAVELELLAGVGGQTATNNQRNVRATVWAIFDCLNLKKSWQDFIEEPYDEHKHKGPPAQVSRRVELEVLNPIKSVGCGFVVVGHSIIVAIVASLDSVRASSELESDPAVLCIIMGVVVVDTFFVMGGALMAYVGMRRSIRKQAKNRGLASTPSQQHELNTLHSNPTASANQWDQVQLEARPANIERDPDQEQEQLKTPAAVVHNGELGGGGGRRAPWVAANRASRLGKRSPLSLFLRLWLKFALQRHFRLLPLYFLVYAFKRAVLIHWAASGRPLHDDGFNRETLFGACKRESWWVPFTLRSAFLPLAKQCLPQAWSVSTDLFFSLLVTPIVLVMARKPLAAFWLGLPMALLGYGWSLHAFRTIPPHLAHDMGDLRARGLGYLFTHAYHLYTHPHFRLPLVLIGLLVGYALHRHREGHRSVWPDWVRDWLTRVSLVSIPMLFIVAAFSPRLKHLVAPYQFEAVTHVICTGRILWALGNGVLIIRMATDWKDGFWMRQFAGRFWAKLAKLNLALLLIHLDIILFFISNSTSLAYFSKQSFLVHAGATLVFAIPAAIALHVVFENPLDKLVRRHMEPRLLG